MKTESGQRRTGSRTDLASSPMMSHHGVAIWATCWILCQAAELPVPAAAFLFLTLLGILCNLWGRHALDEARITASSTCTAVFPGETVCLETVLENGGLFPIPWLEMIQNTAPRECLTPEETVQRITIQTETGDGSRLTVPAFCRTFHRLASGETQCITTCWHANRRGIYVPNLLRIRSGDGFGLLQMQRSCPAELLPEIVVWPQPVPVRTEDLVQMNWEQTQGSAGFLEDVTVISGMRPYNSGDRIKSINWRMEARGMEELQVNCYETIRPAGVLFVLDGESFFLPEDGPEDSPELEDTIRVMASAITELSAGGIWCGLCLPEGESSPAALLPPSAETSVEELLTALAGYEPRRIRERREDGSFTGKNMPSCFPLLSLRQVAAEAGTRTLFTADPDGLNPDVLHAAGDEKVRIYVCTERKPAEGLLPVHHLWELKGSHP